MLVVCVCVCCVVSECLGCVPRAISRGALFFKDVEEDVELSEVDDTYKGVAQNKSVIMYMLGQIKIGMDLSKVGGVKLVAMVMPCV